MYADKVTDSMKNAIGETNRRREKQMQFNKDNGIKPKTIIKNIQDIMEGIKTFTNEKIHQNTKSD